jgi:hypothetical protein|tara:strand:- start:315 stop:512 length:198 start_codon:yes stop_codon:yes gene_type:complete
MTDLKPEQFDQMWLQFASLGAERERERIVEAINQHLKNTNHTRTHFEYVKAVHEVLGLIKGQTNE